MAEQDLSRPFIGYRSAGRRPEQYNDRIAAASAPLAALRGWAAGTAGLPGDIEGLLRMVTPGASNTPALPTSDFYKEWLPGRSVSASPVGKSFTEAGSLFGGTGSTGLAGLVRKGATEIAKTGLGALSKAIESGHPMVAAAQPMYIVPPRGNLNLTPVARKEILKGPEKQSIESFMNQIKGTPGVSKEGAEEIAGRMPRFVDFTPGKVVSKSEFEQLVPPSEFSKVDLASPEMQGAFGRARAEELARDLVHQDPTSVWEDVLNKLDVKWGEGQYYDYVKAIDDLYNNSISVREMPEGLYDALHRRGYSHDEGPSLEFYDLVDKSFNRIISQTAYDLMDQNEFWGAGQNAYSDYQRLVPGVLGDDGYFEIGVTHPSMRNTEYNHYSAYPSEKDGLVGHVRGTRFPEDMSDPEIYIPGSLDARGVMPTIKVEPNSYVIEEIQSDAQKGAKQVGALRQVHGTLFKAAIQHALESGSRTVYYPTAETIATVRSEPAKAYAPIYDKQIIQEGLKPLSKIKGVTVDPVMVEGIDKPAYYKIQFDDNAVEHILRGEGQSAPGYARGGEVRSTRESVSNMAEDADRAYVGYRSAGRRRPEHNDRRAAADAPLAALRGFVSGVAGAPGDIESLIRMLPGLSERTVLPTSEDIEKRLPLPQLAQSPLGRAATSAGQFGGGFYNGPLSPLRAAFALPGVVGRAGREFVQAAGQPAVNVVKPRGGNWLAGSVENALRPLKRSAVGGRDPAESAEVIRGGIGQLGSGIDPKTGVDLDVVKGHYQRELERMMPDAALNTWIDKKLAKYIKNEMATPEDPVRALAERGTLHFDPEAMPRYMDDVWSARESAGFPKVEGISPLAQKWEAYADQMIRSKKLDGPIRSGGSLTMRDMIASEPGGEWALKASGDQPVYELRRPGTSSSSVVTEELGFDHLVDELRNALNPESGLPQALQLTPEQLSRVSTPQAVELVSKINTWRAEQKAAADLARANNAASVLYREYPNIPGTELPNERGLRWVELRQPKNVELSDDVLRKAMQERDMTPDEIESALRDPEMRAMVTEQAYDDVGPLADALKYEGETMGHCVGGYCPDVLEGRSRIFSLRDAKGEPHVTVEVAPQRGSPYDLWYGQRAHLGGADPEQQEFLRWMQENKPEGGLEKAYESWARATGREIPEVPQDIIQIKGKQNRAPKEEYLPFVQDFVRSQQWGKVGDLSNTGLRRWSAELSDVPRGLTGRVPRFQEADIPAGYYTEQELLEKLRDWQTRTGNAPGYAAGGAVTAPAYATFDPAGIDAAADALMLELAER